MSESKKARIMPNNYEAEQSVLGAAMIDNDVAGKLIGELREEDFYHNSHRQIFKAMREVSATGKPVDFITLSDYLDKQDLLDKVGGISYLTDLTNILPSSANYKYYQEMVQRDGMLRRIIGAANGIVEYAYSASDSEEALAFAQKSILDILQGTDRKDLVHIDVGITEVIKRFNDIFAGKEDLGLMSGFKNLDNIINGYQPGQMIVLAARPGCGKTSFAMNMVANIALKHPEKVIAVFNLEMSIIELSQRLALSVAEVPKDSIVKDKNVKSLAKLWPVKKGLMESNVYVADSTGVTPDLLISKLRQLKLEKGRLDFVVIDYLQLLRSAKNYSSFQVEVADISRSIKIMAKELEVPVFILSQTSRDLEKRNDKEPKLSDLRDSGAIEQDADQVYFLTKDDKQEYDEFEIVTLNILKHRSGSTGKIHFKWYGNIVKFVPIAESDFAQYRKAKNEEGEENNGEAVTPVEKENAPQEPTIEGVSVERESSFIMPVGDEVIDAGNVSPTDWMSEIDNVINSASVMEIKEEEV